MGSRAAQGRGRAHIADLVLGLPDSLQLGRVRQHAEAFAFVFLKLFLIANLEVRKGRESGLRWRWTVRARVRVRAPAPSLRPLAGRTQSADRARAEIPNRTQKPRPEQ